MIQINLLPDVKQQLIAVRRTRNMVISMSIFVALAAGGVVLLLALLVGVQLGRDKLAQDTIKSEYAKLSEVKDLNNLVTIQNQLTKIDALHANKSVDSRIFAVLQVVNPAAPNTVKFTNVTITPEEKKLVLEGTADGGYSALEGLEKTIGNTKIEYTLDGQSTAQSDPLANEVIVTERSYGEDSDGKKVLSFKMEVTYQDQLFTNTAKSVRIVGPTQKIDVTDSRVRVPESLFGSPVKKENS
jgi:hypothetical protein